MTPSTYQSSSAGDSFTRNMGAPSAQSKSTGSFGPTMNWGSTPQFTQQSTQQSMPQPSQSPTPSTSPANSTVPAQQFQQQAQQAQSSMPNANSWWPYMAPPNFQGVPPGTLHPSQIPALADTPGGIQTTSPFAPGQLLAPFYSVANTAGALGSMSTQAAPGAAAWSTELFNPGFNSSEQMFMQNMSQLGSDQFAKTMAGVGQKFGKTPFHSAYLQAAHDLARNANKDLLQAGGQLQQQRQQLSGATAQRVLGNPLEAANMAPQVATSLMQLFQNLGTNQSQLPLQLYTQIPFSTPTVIQSPAVWGNR